MSLEATELEVWSADTDARRSALARREFDGRRSGVARIARALLRRVTGARARERLRRALADVAADGVASQVDAMCRAGDFQAAEQLLLEGRRRLPGRIELIILHAELAMAAGDWQRAIERWRRLIALFGDGAPEEATARLAAALRSMGELRQALDALERAGRPRTATGRIASSFERGATLMALGDLESAERDWRLLLDDRDLTDTLRPVVREVLTSIQRGSGRTPDPDLHPERLITEDHLAYDAWLAGRTHRSSAQESVLQAELPRCAVIVVDRGGGTVARRSRDQFLGWDEAGLVVHAVEELTASAIERCRRTINADALLVIEEGMSIDRSALEAARIALWRDGDVAIVSADEDGVDESGNRSHPILRSAFDPDLLLVQPALGHAVVFRSSAIDAAGGFRDLPECPHHREHDLLFLLWDLSLRIVFGATGGTDVHRTLGLHVPEVLIHHPPHLLPADWTGGPGWSAESSAASALVRRSVDPRGTALEVRSCPWGVPLRVRPKSGRDAVRVSIVIPTRDRAELLKTCVDGLLHRTTLEGCAGVPRIDLEVVIVDNDTREPDALELLDRLRTDPRITVVAGPGEFNFSRLVNAGVAAATGEVCVLLNNDVVVLEEDWLIELVAHALRPEVGAVGALLEHSDGRVQHAGVLVGVNGTAEHALREWPSRAAGYLALLRSTRRVSAVTAACLAVRREVYERVGGLDESALPVELNDVDLCLRIGDAGLAIIWTPFARLAHREGGTRGRSDRASVDDQGAAVRRRESQRSAFSSRWRHRLSGDPFYSPHFSVSGATYLLRR